MRLIGGGQQLAAISAGGVLRDIAHTHGAVALTEVMRFTDPAEAAASLALREGRTEALGFYLDVDHIHPGSHESSSEAAFQAWAKDLAEGRDSLMLAGTREVVAELNRRARDHRLTTSSPPPRAAVSLGDGNHASAGDVIITRMNDRRLPVSATNWVKNGDRWTVQEVTDKGALVARHRSSGLRLVLPPGYVAEHVHLGYAVTVHSAQGITVDVVETILFRDGSARSATTEVREATAPAPMLTDASARYLDTLHVAAESTLDPDVLRALDRGADGVVTGLTGCPAWPTLRAALILNALDGKNPLDELRAASATHELDSAHDPAAVLTWRLPRRSAPGPLPWLPPIPDTLANHSGWNPYPADRAGLVARWAQEMRLEAQALDRPAWALPGQQLNPVLISDVEVWRAAVGVDPSDRRPTGPVQLGEAARTWQKYLETRLRSDVSRVWADMLADVHPRIHDDPFAVALTHHVANLHSSGVSAAELLARATDDGPLPAEHTAAALWWRLSRKLDQNDHTGSVASAPTEVAALVGATKNIDHDSAATGEQAPRLPLDLIPAGDEPKDSEGDRETPKWREQRREFKPVEPLSSNPSRASRVDKKVDYEPSL